MAVETPVERIVKFVISTFIAPVIFVGAAIYNYLTTGKNNSSFCADYKSELAKMSMEKHKSKVQDVQEQVRAWNTAGRNGFMCTARPGWQSVSVHNIDKSRYTQIKVDLNDFVDLDTENMVVTVEPGMTMGRLTSILNPIGWTIPVIPEFELLTVGGCICGAGLETSSHKYGLFSDTAISYEIVLADGQVICCSETENSDLYYSIPMSHGTLGFLTAVQFPLIRATKYVQLEYHIANSVSEISQKLHNKDAEFVEGLLYEPNRAVIMYGNFVVDENEIEPSKINFLYKWYKPWFYKHVEAFLKQAQSKSRKSPNPVAVEYIPLRDYYHRHSRSYFWETEIILPYGNHWLFRLLLGWIYPINHQILKRTTPSYVWDLFCVNNHVLQDFVVPIDRLKGTLEFSDQLVQVYPIWLCPCIRLNKPGHGMVEGAPPDMYIDIGIYGTTPKCAEFDAEVTTRKMEQFTIKNKGFQATYADVYMTREEFHEMFEVLKDHYERVRVKYGCVGAFPEVYDKISLAARGRSDKNNNLQPQKKKRK